MRLPWNSRLLSWLLLLYFTTYVIPPTSSLADTAGLSEPSAAVSLAQGCQHIKVFLYDIIMWQYLEQARHTDSSDILRATIRVLKEKTSTNLTTDFFSAALPGTTYRDRFHDSFHTRLLEARYTASGISPPLFV